MPKQRYDATKIYSAIQAVVEKRQPKAQVARDAGVSSAVLGGWIRKYQEMSPEDIAAQLEMTTDNRYIRVMRKLFERHIRPGARGFIWQRKEINEIAAEFGFAPPANLGDNIYSIRYGREELPEDIQRLAPRGKHWLLLPNGRGIYQFALGAVNIIEPEFRPAIKIPDATPQIVGRYALGDEQAVLARLRYNRLIDIFLGVTSSALQSHLRATVAAFAKSQIETDELYVGVDLNGVQYIVPVQAKGADENVGAVQAKQDIYCCREKFPDLVCRAIAAKTVEVEKAPDGSDIHTIAMMELAIANKYDVWIPRQERYQLVPASMITADELEAYRKTAASRLPSLKKSR